MCNHISYNTISRKRSPHIPSIWNISLITSYVNLNIQNSTQRILIPRTSSRDLIAAESVPAAGGSTTATLADKESACVCILRWLIAISYHCPVAACCVHARRQGREGQRGPRGRKVGWGTKGRDEERGRWHRLPRCQVAAGTRQPSRNICRRLPRKRAQERTTDFSSLLSREAKGPSSPTDANRRSRCVAGPVSYFVSFPKARRVPLLPSPSSLLMAITSVSFIPAACSKIFNFGRWHVPNGRIISPLLLPFFFSSFVKSRRWNYSRATS